MFVALLPVSYQPTLHLYDPCGLLRRYKAKKKAFTKYVAKYGDGKKSIEEELGVLKKHCTVIRVLVHTQIKKIGFGQKKAHLAEIQVRGAVAQAAWLGRCGCLG